MVMVFCRASEWLEWPPSPEQSTKEEGKSTSWWGSAWTSAGYNNMCITIQQVPENYTPPAPITSPIMAPLGADPQAQLVSSGAPQVPYSGMQQQPLSSPPMNPAMPTTSMEGAPGAPTGDVIQVQTYRSQLENVRHTARNNSAHLHLFIMSINNI